MPTPKQAHALTSYFQKLYREKYGMEPKLNRYAARWGFDSMLMDMSDEAVKGLIEYYFQTVSTNGHALDWFFYNYEKLADAKVKAEEDAAALKELREQSRIRTEEWRKKHSG